MLTRDQLADRAMASDARDVAMRRKRALPYIVRELGAAVKAQKKEIDELKGIVRALEEAHQMRRGAA